MLFRFCSWALVLAASSVLIAGCAAPRPPSAAQPRKANPSNESVRNRTPAKRVASKRPADAPVPEADLVEAHAHYAAGILYDLNHEAELALKDMYEAALKNPQDEELVLEISRRFLQARETEKVLELLTRATAQPNASGALFARLGFVYSQLGKPELAMDASRTAIQRQPRSLSGYQNLFLNHLQNKQPDEALAVLNEAAGVSQTAADFLIGLAELYTSFALQEPTRKPVLHAQALSLLQRAEKMKVTDLQLRLRLADEFNLLGKPEKAAQIYSELLKRLPDVPFVRENIRNKLADIYLRGENRTRAVEQLEAITRENPTDPQAYYYLGSIAYEARDYTNAADQFAKIVAINPEFEQAYYDLAGAQMAAEKNPEAIGTLEKARQKFASNFALEYLTASAYSRLKDYSNSLSHFVAAETIAQANEPKRLTETFYFQMAAAYERKGEFSLAEKYFGKCLEQSPAFAEAQNYLGYMWTEQDQKLDQARLLIEAALKAEPDNAAFLDSMGWVLFKLKQPKPALDYMLKAVKASEEPDATLYDHLGDIYAALGQRENALAAWRKSLTIEPNDQVKKKVQPETAK